MKARWLNGAVALVLLLAVVGGMTYAQEPGPQEGSVPQAPVGTAFTYQGLLTRRGNPAEDTCDFRFVLWDDPTAGAQVAGPLVRSAVSVARGRFTVALDFGNVYNGTALWLQVEVQCSGDSAYTSLSPRQEVTPAPYSVSTGALQGRPVTTTGPGSGQVLKWDGSAWIPAVDADTTYSAGAGLVLTGTVFSADPGYLQLRVTGACGAGFSIRQVNPDGSVVCEADDDTNYTAGTGLQLLGTEFSLLAAYSLPQGCTGTQIAKWNGSAWVCAADDNTTYSAGTGLQLVGTQFSITTTYRLPQGCTGTQIARWNGSAWVCAADQDSGGDITAVYAGPGLTGGGAAGDVTLNADPAYMQRRVTETCGIGSSIRQINADGTVVCEPDNDTTYSAGTGLVLTGTVFSADPNYLQRRVSGTCAAGYAVRQVNPDGSVVCQLIDNTTYTAGTGLQLVGTEFSLLAAYSLPQGCTDGFVARWVGGAWVCVDYHHGDLSGLGDDDHPQYFNLAQDEIVTGVPTFAGGDTVLQVPPFTVTSAYPVQNLDADLLDRRHAGNARYEIPINNNAWNEWLNADRLDGYHLSDIGPQHTHWNQTWSGSFSGVRLNSTSASGAYYGVRGDSASATGYGVYGINTGGGYGVYGSSSGAGGYGVYGVAGAASGVTYGVYGTVTSPDGWAGYFNTSAGNGVYISAPLGKVGLNVASGLAQVAGNTIWHAGNDGAGTGLDADLLDGLHGAAYQPRMVVATRSGTAVNALQTGTCTNQTDGWVTINTPGAGTVIVEANVQVALSHVSGATPDRMLLAIGANSTDCYGGNGDYVIWSTPGSYPSFTQEYFTFTVRRAFSVAAAGSYTYYVNGMMVLNSGGAPNAFNWSSIHAVYYP